MRTLCSFLLITVSLGGTVTVGAGAFGEGLCDNLAKFACSPGDHDDGTGVASVPQALMARTAEVRDQNHPALMAKFKAILDSPENSYFKKEVLSAFGLTYAPECNKSAPAEKEKCLNEMAEGVSNLSETALFGFSKHSNYNYGQQASAADLDLVTNNPLFTKTTNETYSQVHNRLLNPELANKIQLKILPNVKAIMKEKIKQHVADSSVASKLIEKVDAIQWDGLDCYQTSSNKIIATMFVPNAFYSSQNNTLKLCSGWLDSNQSEFSIIMAMSHELSHSIDPCQIAYGPSDFSFHYSKGADQTTAEQEYPFHNLISCLRRPDSVGATHSVPPPPANCTSGQPGCETPTGPGTGYGYGYGGYGPMPPPGYQMPSGGSNLNTACPMCAATAKPGAKEDFSFCIQDQITESFADWMAYEILPDYMERTHKNLTKEQFQIGYANSFRSACGGGGSNLDSDEHPQSDVRVNAILLANPQIRKQMGCPEKNPEHPYCTTSENPVTTGAQKDMTKPGDLKSGPVPGGVR